VTGAASGIGLATARALAAEGASVVIGDLESYEDAADSVRAGGGEAVGVQLDVTAAATITAAVRQTVERFGGLNILVNNAGIGWPRPLADLDEADWDRVVGVNLKGPYLCMRAAAPHLAGGGAVVNVSSLAGRSSSPLQGCHYSASKAGLLGLTRHLARELAPRGIRVNAVCPGLISTGIFDRTTDPEARVHMAESVPLGRLGTPEDMASVIVFLASDDAGYVTGAYLDANGGVFMA